MKTVYVGLSGGVDSATSAYVLKQLGYRVIGVFIQGWEPDFLPCTGKEDRVEAMRVAAHLEIPFRTYDLSEEYKKEVVDYFVSEYKKGNTPNPDVICNRAIKFGAFWNRAKKEGADFIATGHYATIRTVDSVYRMQTSADTDKDQTYFLWTLTQDDLSHTLFPIGSIRKPDVRKLALKAKLPNAQRKDSQGLCFLGHVDMHDFLARYIPPEKGKLMNEGGIVVGEHDGAWFYTLGQHMDVGGLDKRVFVIAKDVARNTITVSEDSTQKSKLTFTLVETHWMFPNAEDMARTARYRYRQGLLKATVKDDRVLFTEPQLIASGQSVVFYDSFGTTCLGGAIVA